MIEKKNDRTIHDLHKTAQKLTIEGKVWRYQRGNQRPKFKEGQTIQWPKEKC